MQERFNKYFWDSKSGRNDEYILRRILSCASFPDLLAFPFEKVKQDINSIDISKLWTSNTRKQFLVYLKPYIGTSDNWNDAIDKFVAEGIENLKKCFNSDESTAD